MPENNLRCTSDMPCWPKYGQCPHCRHGLCHAKEDDRAAYQLSLKACADCGQICGQSFNPEICAKCHDKSNWMPAKSADPRGENYHIQPACPPDPLPDHFVDDNKTIPAMLIMSPEQYQKDLAAAETKGRRDMRNEMLKLVIETAREHGLC